VPLELVEKLPGLGVPDAHNCVETARSEEFAVRREDDGGNAGVDGSVLGNGDIVNSEGEDAGARFEVPHASGLVA